MNNRLSDQRGDGAGISKISVLAIVAAVLAASFLCVFLIRFLTEPRYKDKRISFWVKQLGRLSYNPDPELHLAPFHHIGTNSLPYLCKAAEARESNFRELLEKWRKNLPSKISTHLPSTQWDATSLRRNALNAIGMFGPEAAMAIPVLTNAMYGPDSTLALASLEKIGPKASKVIPALVQIATNGSRSLATDRLAALRALSRIDVEGAHVEKLLGDASNEPYTVPKTVVLIHCFDHGRFPSPLIPTLLTSLESSRDRFQQASLLRLMARSDIPFESVKETLLKYAKSPDAIVCDEALRALSTLGPTDNSTRQLLLSNVNHDVARVRAQAVQRLASVSEAPVPEALALLTDPVSTVRVRAAEAAWRWRSCPGDEIARILAELLSEVESIPVLNEIDSAVFALIKEMGPEAGPTVPSLSKILQETNVNLYFRKLEAMKALGSIGPAAASVAAEIQERSQSENPTEALVAMTALWQITRKGEPPVTSILTTIRQSPWLRSTGVEMLERLGPVAQPAIPVLEDYAADKNYPDAAKAAKAALARIRGSDPSGRAAADQKSSAE